MSKVRIMIANDHRLVLDGIVSMLKKERSIEVVNTAADGLQALELIEKNNYDVCLLDINMPKLDGLEAVKQIKSRKIDCRILILTTYNDKEIIAEMLHLGVSGYILKNSSRQELVEAIRKVAEGGMYYSDEVHDTLIKSFREKPLENRKVKPEEEITLTKRETQIVKLLAKGYTNDKVAEELNISYRTVETHRKNIMQKTQSHNLAELLKFAYGSGLILK